MKEEIIVSGPYEGKKPFRLAFKVTFNIWENGLWQFKRKHREFKTKENAMAKALALAVEYNANLIDRTLP